MKHKKTSVISSLTLAALLLSASADTTVVYDWSTATAGPLEGNDNWVRISSSGTGTVANTDQPTGFSGNFAQFSNVDQIYDRVNDANFGFSIPSNAETLSLSYMLTTSSASGNRWMGPIISTGAGNDQFRIGSNQNTWVVREIGGNIIRFGNPSGEAAITSTKQSYLVTADIDLVNNTLDFWVDNLGTPDPAVQIATGQAIDDFDPALFDGLRIRAASSEAGTFTISHAVSSPSLRIHPAEAPDTGFDLEWDSQAGKLYNLRTSTDLVGAIADWTLVAGGEDIAATPPTNSFNVDHDVARRFFAVEEFDAPPPPPIFAAMFEEDDDGFTVSTTEGTAWAHGNPDSSSLGGSVTTGNDSSTNCWGTNLGNHAGGSGDPGFYSNPTDTSLRSPVIDLTDVAAATLTFAQALDLDTGDSAIVNIIDDTTDTVIAAEIVAILDDNTINANWETIGPVAIPAAALGRAVRIEWRLSGTGGFEADFMGWYIDDVVVAPTTP